jgi:hypothetical protein
MKQHEDILLTRIIVQVYIYGNAEGNPSRVGQVSNETIFLSEKSVNGKFQQI